MFGKVLADAVSATTQVEILNLLISLTLSKLLGSAENQSEILPN